MDDLKLRKLYVSLALLAVGLLFLLASYATTNVAMFNMLFGIIGGVFLFVSFLLLIRR